VVRRSTASWVSSPNARSPRCSTGISPPPEGDLADELGERIAAALARREAEAPWSLGTTSLGLARELTLDEAFLLQALAAEVDAGRLAARAGYYFSPGHRPQLSAEQQAFFDGIAPPDPEPPLIPVAFEDVRAALRRARIAGLAQAFDTLLATGVLVKVGTDLYRGTQIAEIRARLEAAIRSAGPITLARFRDAIGTTRKYAVPLMEWFDATGVTVRDGDLRGLRDQGDQRL
jgi:selenocysteine-specific elongation factor